MQLNVPVQLRVCRQQDQQRGAAENFVQERHGCHVEEEPERPLRKVLLNQRWRGSASQGGNLAEIFSEK